MKKMLAILAALVLACTVTAVSLAEKPEESPISGIQFNMDMDQVMQLVNRPDYEIDREKTRGSTEFWELEYEHVSGDDFSADIKFLFVGNGLVAIHYDMADGTRYEDVKADLVRVYGEAVPFDDAKIGNGRYAIDDDGDLRNCREMIETDSMTIVLEQDHDGDVDVTYLDLTAAYINN